ncbi:MAG TPA: outer membrane beta-barrel family protein [Flavitalea sp.]|nr:outer membrane beta-barrel family protein [Flavitalea sp.]
MIKHFLAALSLLLTFSVSGQVPTGPRGGGNNPQMNMGRFYGRVVDDKTGKGVDAASIQLMLNHIDPRTKEKKDSLVGGMLTRKSGEFTLESLPLGGEFTLTITAIGYKTHEQEVSFGVQFGPGMDMSKAMAAADRDLGNIKIEQDAETLEAVTVSASKPLMQMGIDRKIFNVEKNISSTGGTAVDIMRNIPSLNVDIDGNITLRNSSPQIFVDGRPTTLSLDQIPADAIASVELITNPSAKFDASGGQSGILNVVLKKNRKVGYNGGIRAGIDSRARVNLGGDINARQGKINAFASAFLNQRKSKNWGETDRNSLLDQSTTFQQNNGIFTGGFGFTRFGLDYFINNRNTLTISQNISGGNFNRTNYNSMIYGSSDPNNNYFESQYRNTLGGHKFRNYGTSLAYKHLFANPGQELTADITYNRSKSTNFSDIYIRSFNDPEQLDPKFPEQLQNITGSGNNRQIVAQMDYVNPINENMKWEGGLRTQVRSFESNQLNFLNSIPQTALDNEFAYTDYVFAAYGIFSQKVGEGFSYQAGLRAESSKYDGEQLGKERYANSFPISLFPSIFLNKSIGDRQDIQLNYSRKINRPNFFQLMPNTDFSDTLNLQTGNPALTPEFTHSLELSYQKTYGEKNNTFLATLFGKYITNQIARYQSLRPIADTVAFVSSWINANTAYAAGVELIFRNTITSWWELNLNTNLYYSKINGSNIVPDLENERISSFSKLNNTFKFGKGWSLQLSGEYQSKSALPVSTSNSGEGGGGGGRGWMGGPPSTSQGYINANYGADIGLRKDFKIKNNQASLSVNMNDIFRTRRYWVHSESISFVQDEWRRRDPRIVRLNFNYRFGKMDRALFKRKNTRSEGENMQGGMENL